MDETVIKTYEGVRDLVGKTIKLNLSVPSTPTGWTNWRKVVRVQPASEVPGAICQIIVEGGLIINLYPLTPIEVRSG